MFAEDELLARCAGLTRRDLRRFVAAGWVRPGRREGRIVYRAIDVARIDLILDMRRDLGLTGEGLQVALDLMDQVYGLRWQLRRLAAAVEAQPPDVRRAIARHLDAGPPDA
ncbi:MAG: chaperone modulator CbpM [Alphaproteobacteria bacterium]